MEIWIKTDWGEFSLFCLEYIIIDAFENEKDPFPLSTWSIKEKLEETKPKTSSKGSIF